MKRYNNLYQEIIKLDNIESAHRRARKGKTHYEEVKMVDEEPSKHFKKIRNMLRKQTFRNSNYKVFTTSDSGKERTIYKLPYFPDRIIHHCIMNIVEPIWRNQLIRDTFSSIKGRGIHDAAGRVKKSLWDKENTRYCLKMDVKKYYPSIDNVILKEVVRHKIKDQRVLWLLDEIIDSSRGVPIGNYLSQYFANLYPVDFDHWAKNNCYAYFRYCDDMVFLHKDKDYLHKLKDKAEHFLNRKLNLKVKQDWQVFPIDARGIDFVGYRFFHSHTLLRKKIKKGCIKIINKRNLGKITMKQAMKSLASYNGWLSHCNSYNFRKAYNLT